MKIRSKKYTDMLRRTLFVIAILTGTVSLPSLVWGQTNRHAGGKNDGYTRGCVPPVIQSVRGLKNGGCVEDGDLYLSVQATGTNVNYQWQKQNPSTRRFEPYVPQTGSEVEGMDGPKLSFIQTTDLDNGYYRCVLSNECSDDVISDTFFVDISSKPLIKSGLFDRNVCVGEQVMYSVVAEAQGDPEYTYVWYKNGSVLSGVNQSFYTFKAAATKKTTDVYTVKVTNKCGSVRDTSKLTISVLPVIESFTDTVWVCRDSSVTLSVKVKEGGDYTYELYQVNYPSLEETLVWMGIVNTCTLENIGTSGVYRWKVNNDCGSVSGDLMYVKVEDAPVIVTHPKSDTVCEGTTLMLTCAVAPAVSSPLTYVWYKDGISISRSPQNYLRLRNVSQTTVGDYRCEVYNTCPSVKTEVAHVEVKKKPQVLIQPSVQGYYCEGDSLSLSVTLDDAIEIDSVCWYYGNVALTDNDYIRGSKTTQLVVTDLKAADVVKQYRLKIYNQCGIVESAAVQVKLHYPARFVRNASDGVDLILCGGENQTLYVSATGSDTIRYTWTFNGKVIADGYSNRLTVKGENLDASGEYVCQVQNSCGNDKVVSYVKQSLPPLSDFTGGGHYCAGEKGMEACLITPNKYTTYQLYKKASGGKGTAISDVVSGDTVSGNICYDALLKGTYYVVARDTNACERVMNGEVVVVEDSLPLRYRLKIAREICEGNTDGDLLLENSQSGIEYYLCRKNDTGWDTLSTPYVGTGKALPLNHLGAGQYKLFGYNPSTGCKGDVSDVVNLSVCPLPQLYDLFFRNKDSVYCANVESHVILQYSQWTSGYRYQLKNNGTNQGTALTSSSLEWRKLPEGHYTLEITNNWGCKSVTSEREVIAQQPPKAFSLEGEPYFCADIPEKQIVLTGSVPGYTYQVRSLNGKFQLDTLGTGRAINIDVPVESGSYYVVAVDNTPKRCRAVSDTLVLRRSDIRAVSKTISVDYGNAVRLGVSVSGYIGSASQLQWQWDNVDKLAGSGAVANPETTVVTESRLYKVTVTDSLGCTATATVMVKCFGGPLGGEIRLSDCMTDAGDTVVVCLGSKMNFCGMASGGVEKLGFYYTWWDNTGVLDTTSSLIGYAPDADGYLYWKVVNGSEEIRDSVWIKINQLDYPDGIPVLHKSGLACKDSVVTLSLSEKRPELTYTLKKDGVVYTCPTEITDSIKWTLSPAADGEYTVEISDGYCKLILPTKVKVNRMPRSVNPEGNAIYCAGSAAELSAGNVESGVDYWLCDAESGKRLKKGSLSSNDVVFGGCGEGTYYIEAVSGECVATGDSIGVTEIPLPLNSLNVKFERAGVACSGKENLIVVDGTERGKKYTLYRKGKTAPEDVLYGDGGARTFKPVTAAGIYVIYARDTMSGCEVLLSQSLEVLSAPAGLEFVGDSVYCAGEASNLMVKNAELGVEYWLYDAMTGDTLKKGLWNGNEVWFGNYTAGKYYAEASIGECKLVSPVLNVREVALPKDSLRLSFAESGAICAGSDHVIRIEGTERGKEYWLCRGNKKNVSDKLYGNGTMQSFKPVTLAGTYIVYAQDTASGCEVLLKQSLKINALPAVPVVEDCSYCLTPGSPECQLEVTNRQNKVVYYLTDGSVTDTLGAENNYFEQVSQGSWQVIAMDTLSGCQSVAKVTVRGVDAPKMLTVNGGCVLTGTSATISTLTTGEGNGVRYILYKNGQPTKKEVVGSGAVVSFSGLSEVGVYRIWAENSLGCGLFMKDSVVVFSGLQVSGDSLYVSGIYCGAQGGVTLSYPLSTASWKYYITDGRLCSDTLNGTGRALQFTEVGGQPVHPGQYQLYVMSPCLEGAKVIARGTVADHALPMVQPILSDTVPLCSGEGQPLVLSGSEKDVNYEIKYYTLSGEYVRNYPVVAGSGNALTLGTFTAAGIYKVYADNGCRVLMDSVVMVSGKLPVIQDLLGNDICFTPETAIALQLSLSAREEGVKYYLYKDGTQVVDSLTSSRPGSLAFNGQTVVGCYEAVAVHEQSGCRKPMRGVHCAGSISEVFDLLPDAGDTVKICENGKYGFSLSGSEKGVSYVLYRDRAEVMQVLAGTGGQLNFDSVNRVGSYRVKAEVGDCELWMRDSVYLDKLPLPVLALKDTFLYCEGEKGVRIQLSASETNTEYTLITPDGKREVRSGNALGGAVEFADVSNLAGYYYVEAHHTVTGCYGKDSTVVMQQTLPKAFDLVSEQGNYICVDGSVTLTLQGTEKNVSYELFRTNSAEALVTRQGTGAAIQFTKIKDAGVYFVTATAQNGVRCQNDFGSLELKLADTVRIHQLIDIKGDYCFTDEEKGTVGLDGSHKGVDYELLRDGANTGLILAGTGDTLLWTKVEGKACAGTPGEVNSGYKYTVVARDTLTGCQAYMYGIDTVIESNILTVWTYQPNEAVEKCEGERIDFNVVTSGCGEIYTWYHNDSVLYEGRRNYYNLDSIKTTSGGIYHCEVKNSCSESRTPDIEVTVRKTVQLAEPMEDVWACAEGENVMISSGFVNANGYYWYKEDAPGRCLSTKDYLFLASFKKSMAGKYICKAGGSALDCNVVYDTCEVVLGEYPVVTGNVVVDTVCVGTVWQTAVVNIENAQTVIWKHNEDTLNFSGQCFNAGPVSVSDAGNYLVEVTNQCGTKVHVVGKLYVDQPLTVDTVSPALSMGCIGETKDLFIKVSPANGQEKYVWYQDGEVVGNSSSYLTPAYTQGGTYGYQVWYTNKCTSGVSYKEVSVHVPEKLTFIEPDRNVSVCAGDMESSALKVTIDPSLMAKFRWYFQKSEETTERVDLNCTTDNLTVSLTRPNSGYYYCEVYNECESKTTQTTWVRVDTIPTVKGQLVNDTVCSHADYRVSIDADGGSLVYVWQIQKRDDPAIEEIEVPLKNELVLRNLSEEYDSCMIWCRIENSCGQVESNSMILRITDESNRLTVTPEVLSICDTLSHTAVVKLEGGRSPWSYRYLTPSQEEKEVQVTGGDVDSLVLGEYGTYRFTWVKNAIGCVVTDSLPTIEYDAYQPAEITFTGGGERCQGDTVSIRIHIEEGRGPWEVTLAQESGGYATEVAEAYPIRMTGRDTVLTFYAEKSDEYYIYQRVKDLGGSCDAVLNAERVKVEMHEVGHVEFRTGWPTHLGRCVSGINLLTTLQPSLNKVPMTKGDFYVNNTLLNGEQWLLNDVAVGCYPIEYRYTDSIGCEVRSDLIRICVDNFPSGRFVSSSVSCGSVASYAEYQMTPADQIDSLTVRMRRYKKWDAEKNPVEISEYATVGFKQSDLKNGLLRLPVTWDNVGMPDSCMVFEVLDIIDRSGCHMRVSSDKEYDMYYRDTVWRHADPEVAIQTKRLGDADWTSGVYEVSMVKGDSVCVKVSLTSGMPVWSLPDVGIEHITGTDTVIWLKEEGTYVFRAKDDYCGRYSLVHPELKVTFRETGYFSGRLWLEGPFDKENAMMSSSIYNKLGLPALSTLTSLPAGVSVIDWIQVELRVGPNVDSVALLGQSATVIAVDSCLLLSDGRLADRTTGDVKVGIRRACDAGTNNRYLVIRHRNHLDIMSKAPVHFIREGETGTLSYIDFTSASNIYTRDGRLQDHMTYISGIGYLMSGGELNTNALISLFDPNRITLQDIHGSAKSGGYDIMHDVNFDGKVDWPGWNVDSGEADWNIVRRNRQKFTEIR